MEAKNNCEKEDNFTDAILECYSIDEDEHDQISPEDPTTILLCRNYTVSSHAVQNHKADDSLVLSSQNNIFTPMDIPREAVIISADRTSESKTQLNDANATNDVVKLSLVPNSVGSNLMIKNCAHDFKCRRCLCRFVTEKELSLHIESHGEEVASNDKRSLFHCVICDYGNNKWKSTLCHMLTHDEVRGRLLGTPSLDSLYGQFACPECRKVFNKKKNMCVHLRASHAVPLCSICWLRCPGWSYADVKRHERACRESTVYRCLADEKCDFSSRSLDDFRLHTFEHGGDSFQCSDCGQLFPTKEKRQKHSWLHRQMGQVCDHCGERFKSLYSLQTHVRRFHETRCQYRCTQCTYVGKLDRDLKRHVQKIHVRKFRCQQCAFTTNRAERMVEHRQNHNADRRYGCEWQGCFIRMATAAQLSQHVASAHHVTGKVHRCVICQSLFAKKSLLMQHILAHESRLQYACEECGRAFNSRGPYYKHRRETGHDAGRKGIFPVSKEAVLEVLERLPQTEAIREQMRSIGMGRRKSEVQETRSDTRQGLRSGVDQAPFSLLPHYFQLNGEDQFQDGSTQFDVPSFVDSANFDASCVEILSDDLGIKEELIGGEEMVVDSCMDVNCYVVASQSTIDGNKTQSNYTIKDEK